MDPLTHTLAGASLGETPLARDVRLGRAALIIGANLPDVDAFSLLVSRDFSLGFRRGWTHGVLADAVLPFLLWLSLIGFDRWSAGRRSRSVPPATEPLKRVRLLGLCFIGVLSHPLLDWLNTYGVRLLMPFDGRWFYGDAIFIIDPWLWLVLGATLLLSRRGTSGVWWILAVATSVVVVLPSSVPTPGKFLWFVALASIFALRRRAGDRLRGARTAVVGVTISLLYIGAMISTNLVSEHWVRSVLEQKNVAGVGRMMVGPLPAHPFRRNVLVEVPGGYRYGSLSLLARPHFDLEPELLERTDSAVLRATLDAPQIEGAVSWMRFPFAEIVEQPDGYRVYLLDARYVRRRTEGFGGAVLFVDRETVAGYPDATSSTAP